ncbi:butyrate kinase [Staphylococcus intermedius]|uniref:Probable butyrate kinase n=1 Tax=Staphylococcus intermedius NCTC 11048 TaxID=1141106 RepID=A0A380G856_STAIN|nr:butyrate kinase [Staphylococcus intermedius]PCF64849.1 butyrate kinase [Staphylococcus intermedius]PCF80459.1 butyrate kinase [Staphylococcus intermedius]PCF81809.1 butyrate kinase [Staphylococcus intermedius]PCF88146.1 butyrate kinase [Staphylococcus intermedius]PCF88860.1 butyrate kinase [Staphylococcus intermedius]
MTTALVLNLGSTSSKYAIYENDQCRVNENINHGETILNQPLINQEPLRQQMIETAIASQGYALNQIDVIACRGGLLKPLEGGTYAVNKAMYDDLKSFKYGAHASNLSGMIGYQLGLKYQIPVFTTDPVVVDELIDEVRHTGVPSIQRRSIFHALNQKAMARRYASLVNRSYEDINVIVIHMGGGISIGAHEKGRVIDVNEALYGEGPMAMDRSGSIPNDLIVQYMEKHQLSAEQMKVQMSRESGLKAYFHSTDLREIMVNYEQDNKVKLLIDSMVIQIAKAIGERATILKGHVDQIIFTGGMSHSVQLMEKIANYVEWIAPISVYPGEHELITLAERAQLALNEQIKIQIYQ